MDPRPKLDCRETFRRFDEYLDRELTAGEMEAVREHLQDCLRCARELEFEKTWIRRTKDKLRRIDVPEDLRKRLERALLDPEAP
jgi:anti-sigma factor (TIGR02949 family)